MKKVEFHLETGFAGCVHKEVFEYEDDATINQIDEDWEEWMSNVVEGGWVYLNED